MSGLVIASLAVALVLSVAAWQVVLRGYGAYAGALATLALFLGLSLSLQTVWRAAHDAYTLERRREAQPHRPGGPTECLSAFVRCYPRRWMDAARALIPRDDTFYVPLTLQGRPNLLELWSYTALLPRTAVMAPSEADWIVSWRGEPTLDLRYTRVRRISKLLTVAEVAR